MKDCRKQLQTTLDAFCKFTNGNTSSASEPNNGKNRDAPESGSEWSGDDSDASDADDFFTLPEDLLARRDAEIREQAEVYEELLQEASSKAK